MDFAKLPEGALVSDETTRQWLGLNDRRWFCVEPHYKGSLLHLRHQVFQPKDVIIFVHGFIGDYVNTWGKPKVLLEDPRFNRNYDFVFYGFKTALFGDVPAFEAEAAKLDRTLTHLEQDYNSITIVTHSKGGLLAMRTLLNRAHEFPAKQPYKIHRIVMFTPLTENVSLAQLPGFVKLLGKESPDIAQMQANTYSELGRVKEDLKVLLNPEDPAAEKRKEAFMKDVAEHLYVINAERDEIVDVGPNGEKIVSEGIRKLSELPTLGVPRVSTLRTLVCVTVRPNWLDQIGVSYADLSAVDRAMPSANDSRPRVVRRRVSGQWAPRGRFSATRASSRHRSDIAPARLRDAVRRCDDGAI